MLQLPGVNGGLYLRTQGMQGLPQVNYVSIEDIDKYTGMVTKEGGKILVPTTNPHSRIVCNSCEPKKVTLLHFCNPTCHRKLKSQMIETNRSNRLFPIHYSHSHFFLDKMESGPAGI